MANGTPGRPFVPAKARMVAVQSSIEEYNRDLLIKLARKKKMSLRKYVREVLYRHLQYHKP